MVGVVRGRGGKGVDKTSLKNVLWGLSKKSTYTIDICHNNITTYE